MNGIVAQEREILARLNFPSNVTLLISPLGVLFFQYGGTSEPEDDDNFIDFIFDMKISVPKQSI